jgi:putative ABC transport system substrate-binding protein
MAAAGTSFCLGASNIAAQQQSRQPRIGFLSASSFPDPNLENFRHGLQALGYVEGRNVSIEVRYAERRPARYGPLLEELLQSRITILVTAGPASQVAPIAGRSIPTVIAFSGDPVDAGLVTSLARPDNNVTGVALLQLDIAAKRVDLLAEAVPGVRHIGLISNVNHPGERSEVKVTLAAADSRGLKVRYFPVRTDEDFSAAFAAVESDACDALMTFPEALSNFNREAIAKFALRHRLPSIFGWRSYAEAGGLMAYGPSISEAYTRVAYYVDRIVRGVSPPDLPIEQPTRIELVLNMRTAKSLGIAFPTAIVARADDLID